METNEITKKPLTGTLRFDEQTQHCYILMDNGDRYETNPLFEFMNEFIDLQTLNNRLDNYYTPNEVHYIKNMIGDWHDGIITPKELYNFLMERFHF